MTLPEIECPKCDKPTKHYCWRPADCTCHKAEIFIEHDWYDYHWYLDKKEPSSSWPQLPNLTPTEFWQLIDKGLMPRKRTDAA